MKQFEDNPDATWIGKISGRSSGKKGGIVYSIQANSVVLRDTPVVLEPDDDEVVEGVPPAEIGQEVHFTYNKEKYKGYVKHINMDRELLHVEVANFSRPCVIGWEEVEYTVFKEDQDIPSDTVEFCGEQITMEEFDLLLGDKTCCQCGMDLEFESGHVQVPSSTDVICASCTSENEGYVTVNRR